MENKATLNVRLCRVNEVAKSLALSRSMIYSMMDSGELKYVRFGSARRIPAEEVERIVRDNTIGGSGA